MVSLKNLLERWKLYGIWVYFLRKISNYNKSNNDDSDYNDDGYYFYYYWNDN